MRVSLAKRDTLYNMENKVINVEHKNNINHVNKILRIQKKKKIDILH